ncbi:MAG: hypothetical protein ACLT1G_02310 [Bacilli bacterium]
MKNNKGLIIGIIGLIIVMIGGTYAYYRWNSTSNINVSVKISGNTVTFVGGSNVTGTLTPVDSKEEGIKKDITVKASEAGSTMSLYMDLTTMPNELKEESFVYELYYNDTTLVTKGNFKAYNASSNASGITYASSGVTTLILFTDRNVNTTTDKYTLYLWFNGKDFTNPDTMQNKTLSFNLYSTGKNATLNG